MTRDLPVHMLRAVEAQRRHQLAIDLDPAAEPIQGWLAEEGQPPRFFLGWLELSSALEQARRGGPAPDADPSRCAGDR